MVGDDAAAASAGAGADALRASPKGVPPPVPVDDAKAGLDDAAAAGWWASFAGLGAGNNSPSDAVAAITMAALATVRDSGRREPDVRDGGSQRLLSVTEFAAISACKPSARMAPRRHSIFIGGIAGAGIGAGMGMGMGMALPAAGEGFPDDMGVVPRTAAC